MNPKVTQLIPHIISEVQRREGSVTKTKLLKLLYLFDVSYYRTNRSTFTEFNWVYLHFGPWTNEYDAVLDDLESRGIISRTLSTTDNHDVEFLSTSYQKENAEDLLQGSTAFLSLNGVLNRWAKPTLKPILNYVYFRTEPMINGTRYEPLDFSTVSKEPPAQYKRNASQVSPARLKELREKAAAIFKDALEQQTKTFSPVEYGEVFYRGLEALDRID